MEQLILNNIIIRILAIVVGLAFGIMGFVLFLRKSPVEVEVETLWGKLKGRVPGIFFIISASIVIFYALAMAPKVGETDIIKTDGTVVRRRVFKPSAMKASIKNEDEANTIKSPRKKIQDK